MTEDQWLKATDPGPMLEFVRGRVSERKLRLFACGCCLASPTTKGIVPLIRQTEDWADNPQGSSLRLGWGPSSIYRPPYPDLPLLWAADWTRHDVRWEVDQATKAALLRDLFGPLPFRLVTIAPSWLAWNDATIPKIARSIYDDRRFDDLPILADALEEAGCSDADILGHCRGPGPHVRGCWVVDLLLGRS